MAPFAFTWLQRQGLKTSLLPLQSSTFVCYPLYSLSSFTYHNYQVCVRQTISFLQSVTSYNLYKKNRYSSWIDIFLSDLFLTHLPSHCQCHLPHSLSIHQYCLLLIPSINSSQTSSNTTISTFLHYSLTYLNFSHCLPINTRGTFSSVACFLGIRQSVQ